MKQSSQNTSNFIALFFGEMICVLETLSTSRILTERVLTSCRSVLSKIRIVNNVGGVVASMFIFVAVQIFARIYGSHVLLHIICDVDVKRAANLAKICITTMTIEAYAFNR